ncbi:MAG TPA: recombinase family protein [Candidatus Thermoplasmatota archaeon]|nr:recombinase family protein [Candidatus Thermoplasmatota archaeon]
MRGPDARPDVIVRDELADAPLRFRILTRISDDKLRSIPQQIADCTAYVEGLGRGGVVDGLYNLGEHSGFSMTESDVYQRLLADAKAGRFHALVARDSSRMGRDYWEKLGFLRDMREAKIEFHVVEDGGRFDFEDRLSKVKSWASTWADEEKKKEEIRKAVRATDAVREAGYPTVTPPYGYRAAKDARLGRKVWRIEAREAAVVRACFNGYAEGRALAELQREHGLTYAQLDRMLRNPSYLGGFVWKGELRRCAAEVVPPLVDEATFERVRARRAR